MSGRELFGSLLVLAGFVCGFAGVFTGAWWLLWVAFALMSIGLAL